MPIQEVAEAQRCGRSPTSDLPSAVSVSSEYRLKRLRDLLDQLERLPATAERDRMLREVRGRVVDVDTGVAPSALPPVYPEESTLPAEPRPPITRAAGVVSATAADEVGQLRSTRRPQPPVSPTATAPAPGAEVAAERSPAGADDRPMIAANELLSLDDPASFSPSEARAELAPWTRGLRG
jgi:hypothetical protein